jgi:hypothetical protein
MSESIGSVCEGQLSPFPSCPASDIDEFLADNANVTGCVVKKYFILNSLFFSDLVESEQFERLDVPAQLDRILEDVVHMMHSQADTTHVHTSVQPVPSESHTFGRYRPPAT